MKLTTLFLFISAFAFGQQNTIDNITHNKKKDIVLSAPDSTVILLTEWQIKDLVKIQEQITASQKEFEKYLRRSG